MDEALNDLEADCLAALRAGDTDRFARYAELLDAQDTEREARLIAPGALGEAALWYASQGVAVFPLRPGGKVPLPGSQGFKDASTDPEQVAAWWAEQPMANIGLPTGRLFDVIDVDGIVGVKAWANLDMPPRIGHVNTPRPGGNHLYVMPVKGRGNRAAIAPGIDYRGLGGYVVAPPSRTDQGIYRWTVPLILDAIPVAAA